MFRLNTQKIEIQEVLEKNKELAWRQVVQYIILPHQFQ